MNRKELLNTFTSEIIDELTEVMSSGERCDMENCINCIIMKCERVLGMSTGDYFCCEIAEKTLKLYNDFIANKEILGEK